MAVFIASSRPPVLAQSRKWDIPRNQELRLKVASDKGVRVKVRPALKPPSLPSSSVLF